MMQTTNIPNLMESSGIRQIDITRRTTLGNETISRIAKGGLNITLRSFVEFCDAAGFDIAEALKGADLERADER